MLGTSEEFSKNIETCSKFERFGQPCTLPRRLTPALSPRRCWDAAGRCAVLCYISREARLHGTGWRLAPGFPTVRGIVCQQTKTQSYGKRKETYGNIAGVWIAGYPHGNHRKTYEERRKTIGNSGRTGITKHLWNHMKTYADRR